MLRSITALDLHLEKEKSNAKLDIPAVVDCLECDRL